jgi:hypothetical protein
MFVSFLLCLIAEARRIVERAAQCRITGTRPGAAGTAPGEPAGGLQKLPMELFA